MSSEVEYPGYPKIAITYWHLYIRAVFSTALLLAFTAGFPALALYLFAPASFPFFLMACSSIIISFAAVMSRLIWDGELDVSQTQFSNASTIIVSVVMVGSYIVATLLIASFAGYGVSLLGIGPPVIAWAVAAFYPYAEFRGSGRNWWMPARTTATILSICVAAVLNVSAKSLDRIPFIGPDGLDDKIRPRI